MSAGPNSRTGPATDRRTHIVGAGLAGLAAAVRLVDAGMPVTIHEAAGHAGGRCRSFRDPLLDRTIDNGNHLILGGNRAVFDYLTRIGARDGLLGVCPAAFPFLDLETGERWTVRPNGGPVPWWLFDPRRRVPETRARDYLAIATLPFAGPTRTVAECFDGDSAVFRRLWAPLAVACLNIDPDRGAARLLGAVAARTFLGGERACRPFMAADGLSAAFVEPALRHLRDHGAELRFHRRLRGLDYHDGHVAALRFADDAVPLGRKDRVVLAVPPDATAALMPDIPCPKDSTGILNAHFRMDREVRLPGGHPCLGLVGGTAEWLFQRGDVVSVTVSAADRLMMLGNEELTRVLWEDTARALGLDGPPPPTRIIRERRATFAQTPAQAARRPGTGTGFSNVVLAGDWTATGLPATIEGAVRSGYRAARAVLDGPRTA